MAQSGNNSNSERWKRISEELKFTKSSFVLLAFPVISIVSIFIIWWDLFYNSFLGLGEDRLLIGIFLVMIILLMAGANIKKDFAIIIVGLIGGLVIEGWGTQTELWRYYTEFPPL